MLRCLLCHYIVLSPERVNGLCANTSRKTMRERVPLFQNSKNPHAKWAAKPPTFGVLFFEFWRGGTRSRIFFLEVFARWPLILPDDNRKNTKLDFSSPTPNRYHSTSFVKTSAPGGFPSSRAAVLTDFLKIHRIAPGGRQGPKSLKLKRGMMTTAVFSRRAVGLQG